MSNEGIAYLVLVLLGLMNIYTFINLRSPARVLGLVGAAISFGTLFWALSQ